MKLFIRSILTITLLALVLRETGPFTTMALFLIAVSLELKIEELASERNLKHRLEALRDKVFRDDKL